MWEYIYDLNKGNKTGWGVKNFFPHPDELLILAYPKNLDGICQGKAGILMLFRGFGSVRVRFGSGSVQSDYIENLSPSLWLLAWLGSALAEVCQLASNLCTPIII